MSDKVIDIWPPCASNNFFIHKASEITKGRFSLMALSLRPSILKHHLEFLFMVILADR